MSPVATRRLRRNDLRATRLPATPHHRTLIHGPRSDRPLLLQLDLEDGLERFLTACTDPDTYASMLTERAAPGRVGSTVKLYPPVQRVMHLAVVEAMCDRLGGMPLSPTKVRSAGLVVRRLRDGIEQRWVSRNGTVLGWVDHPDADRDDDRGYEPQRARRLAAADRADDASARLLRAAGVAADDGLDEITSPAFAVPPAACAALARCVIQGDIPTASSDTTPPDPQPPFDAEFLASAIPGWLRWQPKTPATWPGVRIPTAAEVDGDDPASSEHLSVSTRSAAQQFRADLLWLLQGAGYGTAAATALTAALASLTVGYDDDADGTIDRSEQLSVFIGRAKQVLFDRTQGGALQLPHQLPTIDSATDAAIRSAVVTAFTSRWTATSPAQPRYADRADRYVVRAFVRVAGECGCAERIRWSAPSAVFAIAPWFDSAGRPPQVIALPDLADLPDMKPNVSFAVPPGLRALLDSIDLKGLLDGKKGGGGLEFGMICSFSISIITVIAFVIMIIFMFLLNIVFQWMLWVKICIPFPKKT
jgi:hypothetical protein